MIKNWMRAGAPILSAVLVLGCAGAGLQGYEAPIYTPFIPEPIQVQAAEEKTADGQSQNSGQEGNAPGTQTQDDREESVPAVTEVKEDYTLKDGVYTGTGNGFGGPLTVQVTIKAGKITDIQITDTKDGEEFLQKASQVIKRIIAAQSTNVDTVSGATYSSVGIIEAVRNALAKAGAKDTQIQPVKAAAASEKSTESKKKTKKKASGSSKEADVEYQDGTYTGTGTGFSGELTVQLKIAGGKITSIKVIKSVDDKSYLEKAKKLIKNIIALQSTDVDTVSGATYSSNGIIEAVNNALSKAKITKKNKKASESKQKDKTTQAENSNHEASVADEGKFPYIDGTYTGVGEGYHGDVTVQVTIKNKTITDIKIVSNEDDEAFFNRAKTLTAAVLSKQTTQVDVVSGATYSSRGILEAIEDALAAAKKATDAASGNTSGEDGPQNTTQGGSQTEGGASGGEENPGGETAPEHTYADGTYQGGALCVPDSRWEFDEYYLYLNVVITDGCLTDITDVFGDGASTNNSYIKSAANGTTKRPGVVKQILEMGSNVDWDSVDVFSSATCSSKAIIEAVKAALAEAENAYINKPQESLPLDDVANEKLEEEEEEGEQEDERILDTAD